MTPDTIDLDPLWLSLRLAFIATIILLLIGTPLAIWLAHTRSRFKPVVEAFVALPLVLPPTVLGFYLLLTLGPSGLFGGPWQQITGSVLTFSFSGLVIASVLYSLPFVVQPLYISFDAIGRKPLEVAWCLKASYLDSLFTIAMPMALRAYLTAAVLGFTHTLGEFGIVLMVGGSIPGETRVLSIEIYDRVEVLDYTTAHILSGGLLGFAFLVLLMVYTINKRSPLYIS